MKPEVATTDYKYWEQWNKTKDDKDLSVLLKQVNPLIQYSVFQQKGSLPTPIIEAEAKLQAVNAFKTYDPSKGTKLSTHLTNYLKKVSRLNYQYQEIYKVPEARRIKYQTFTTAKDELTQKYGRPPTVLELAEKLNWSNAEVSRFLSESKQELSDSQPLSNDTKFYGDNSDSTMLAYIYNDLPTKDKLLFEHTTGYGGKPILDNNELAKRLEMTPGQISYAKKKLVNKIVDVREGAR